MNQKDKEALSRVSQLGRMAPLSHGSPQGLAQSSVNTGRTGSYTTPLPAKSISSTAQSEKDEIFQIVRKIEMMYEQINEKQMRVEEAVQRHTQAQIGFDRPAMTGYRQSVVQQAGRVVQLQPDMVVVSMSTLNQIIEDRVRLRVKQYEDSMRATQALEQRVRQLEDSIASNVKSSVQHGPINLSAMAASSGSLGQLTRLIQEMKQK